MKIDDREIEIAYRCVATGCEAKAVLTTNVRTRRWISDISLHPVCPLHQMKMIAHAVNTNEPIEFVDLHLSYAETAVEEDRAMKGENHG